jgi:hypothetical protein
LLFSAALLIFLIKLFWRDNEPKHLLINVLLYWAVVSVMIFYSLFKSQSYNDLTRYGRVDMRYATLLGLCALTVYAFAIYIVIKKVQFISVNNLVIVLRKYSSLRIIAFYIFISLLSAFITSSAIHVPGGQILLSIIYFKWVVLTLMILGTYVIDSNRKLIFVLVIFEILLSFGGFWAAFKNYVFVAIGAYLIFNPRLSFRSYLSLGFIVFLTLSISVVWTFSKGEYRRYLTGGERTQIIVKQDQIANIYKFSEIVQKDFSPKNFKQSFSEGLENLIYRVSYIEFLAMTMNQVPVFLPYENGRLLQNAVEHIIKPRILFPDKKPIYDSELTSKYTGRKFAGAEEGTSFSLGTVAESYVDFGPIYMFIPIFVFGLWVGWMYKYFIVNGYNIIWGLCYSAPIFQFAWSFPVPTSKFLGWSITYFVTFWFINKFLIKYLDQWLLKAEYKS